MRPPRRAGSAASSWSWKRPRRNCPPRGNDKVLPRLRGRWPRSGRTPRGTPGAAELGDSLEHSLQCPLVQYVPCRNAQNFNAAAGEPRIPASISSRIAAHVVSLPVYLDGQLCRRQIEIEDILPDGVLLAEAQSAQRIAPQWTPQQDFREGHFAPQTTGAIEGTLRSSHSDCFVIASSTIPLRFMVPLPRKRGRKSCPFEIDPIRTFHRQRPARGAGISGPPPFTGEVAAKRTEGACGLALAPGLPPR